MPRTSPPRDRFDELSDDHARIGAHRAHNPRIGWLTILVWSLISFLVLTGLGILVTLVLTERLSGEDETSVAPTTQEAVAGEIDPSYAVLVLNATGDEALTTEVRDDLVSAGWSSDLITDADASSHDFETTTVYYESADDEAAARGIAEDILGGANVEMSEAYQPSDDASTDADESDVKQIVVVIGLDRE